MSKNGIRNYEYVEYLRDKNILIKLKDGKQVLAEVIKIYKDGKEGGMMRNDVD